MFKLGRAVQTGFSTTNAANVLELDAWSPPASGKIRRREDMEQNGRFLAFEDHEFWQSFGRLGSSRRNTCFCLRLVLLQFWECSTRL